MKDKKLVDSFDKIKMPEERKQVILKRIIRAIIASSSSIAIIVCGVLLVIVGEEPELQQILRQQEFGSVSISTITLNEIETVLMDIGLAYDEHTAYQDEKYIYLFDGDGNLAGICLSALIDSATSMPTERMRTPVHLSREEAVAAVEAIIRKYDPDYTDAVKGKTVVTVWEASQSVSVIHHPDWRLVFSRYDEPGVRSNIIIAELDAYGEVSQISFDVQSRDSDGELAHSFTISMEPAKELALDALEEEGIDIDLQNKGIMCLGYSVRKNDSPIWEFAYVPQIIQFCKPMQSNPDIFVEGYLITVNSETGKTSVIKYSGSNILCLG